MKFKMNLLLLISIGSLTNSIAQIDFEAHLISNNANGASSVFAIDIDGDGDQDILSASLTDDKIAWYENINGQGSFSSEKVIATDVEGASFAFAADLDGDGDMDVLSTAQHGDKIGLHRNIDGQGNFGLTEVISTQTIAPLTVIAVDIDNDGDMDAVSASYGDDKVAWYENLDGQGTFGSQNVITTNAGGAREVFAADIDGDGDMDILSVSTNGFSPFHGTIAWYRNTDGDGDFSNKKIISTSSDLIVNSAYAGDMDSDGDIDVVSASGDEIVWHENTNGQGSFGSPQVIETNTHRGESIYLSDIDGNGHLDVVFAASIDFDRVSWIENLDGQGSFSNQQTIYNEIQGPQSVYASDMDSDGDVDVLSASFQDNKIMWYENTRIVATQEFAFTDFFISPNPASDRLWIESETTIAQINIYNILNQLLLSNSNQNQIDLSTLSSGVYWCQIKDEKGIIGIKKVVKR